MFQHKYNSTLIINILRVFPLLIIAICIVSITLPAQISYNKITSISEPLKDFTSDAFKNIYAVNTKNELVKYDMNGKELLRYSIREYGTIQIVDASNPFKIIVFYDETNQLVILDNYLSEISNTDLFDLNLISIASICSSTNDELWIFDRFNQQLLRLNNQFNISQQGEKLNESFHYELVPNFMMEYEESVYLNDSSQGIFIFDLFGNFQKSFLIKGLISFQIFNDQLIYLENEQLNILQLELLNSTVQTLPLLNTKPTALRIHGERLYILEGEQLHLYAF